MADQLHWIPIIKRLAHNSYMFWHDISQDTVKSKYENS